MQQSNSTVEPQITLQQIKTDFDGKFCYVHARGAVAPDGFAIITTQPLYLQGSDVFFGLEMIKSADGGKTWGNIGKSSTLVREDYSENFERVICDATPFYHRKSGKLIITGQSVIYSKSNFAHRPSAMPRHTLWSIYDSSGGDWEKFRELELPDNELFFNCGSGSAQIVELPDGDLLIPVYAISRKELEGTAPRCFKSLVLQCSFDGENLRFKKSGQVLSVNEPRGLYEPSVAAFNGKYYMTLRNDLRGYVACSDDGLNYSEPQVLVFDDGTESGNYNTQQHWISASGKLFLVYTRRGAANDHVFRHRAPLFMAEFDPARMCLLRSTEKVVVPERGARLGNFGCIRINENESWVFAAEWMQTTEPDHYNYKRCMHFGSDNSIWIAKIKF